MIKICSIILFILISLNLLGQDLIRYTTKQGLPSNHVYDVAQDSNGFMWFATNRGVVKYDGISFRTFTVKDGLPNNDTWQLESDFQGGIWYFSKSNYQGYIQNDSIYKFMVSDNLIISPSHISKSKDRIWLYDNDMRNYFGVQDNILRKVDPKEFERSTNFIRKQMRIPEQQRLNFYPMLNPELQEYVVFIKNKLLVLDINFNVLYEIEHDISDISNHSRIDNFGSMPNQTFSFATDEGIVFINHKTKSSKSYTYKSLIGREKIETEYLKALTNEIQISVSGYLLRFNYNFELIEKISFPKAIFNHKSYKDRDGNIWFIDTGKGITFQPNTQIQTNYYLEDKKVQRIGEINQSLFVGIPDDGFYEYVSQKDSFIKKISEIPGTIYQIKYNQDRQEGYLVSSNYTLKHKNNRFSQLIFNRREEFVEPQYSFKNLTRFNYFLYIVTANSLSKRNLKTNLEPKYIYKQGLLLAEVHNDSLYIGGSNGLHLLENDSLVKPSDTNELLNTSILSLLSTKDYLMVGTDGRGLYFYNNKEIIHLKNTDDLSIQKIIKKEDALWLASQKGVFKVVLNTNNLANSKITEAFYEEDGLLENNTNDIYIKDNLLYVASDMGLAKLDINNAVYRKKLKLYFKTIRDTLQIGGGQNNTINISFSVLDYVNQENYSYYYRLLPNQTQWLSTTTKTLNFSNYSPNLYTLEVRATDQHGNEGIEKQYLNILPAWWQTVRVKFCFVLLSAFLFAGLIKLIQLRIKKEAERDKRIAGLELQALRSQMNPHFVHNSLNAIQYFIQRSEIDLSEDYLVKFSKLIRLFFEYSRKQNIAIIDELDLLTNYLEIEQLRFEDKLQYKIEVDEKIDQEEQLIPSMILQPIVENAVNHGLFHKEGKGMVTISFTYINDITFQVSIKDDGIGLIQAKEIYKKSSKNYQSRSSAVLHERLALLKQSNDWDISYQIEDLSLNTRTTGTLVTLIFNQSI